jgi:hypothetical protein
MSAVWALAVLTTFAGEERVAQVSPREISVLLLPALDVSAESTNMLGPRRLVIRHREQYEFITRRFKMLGETMATRAADGMSKFDLNEVAARTPENLDALAKRAGADWVVSAVVENARLEFTAAGQFRALSHVRLQVRDARGRDWLVDGTFSGLADGAGSPVFVFKNSLDDAIKKALGTLLDPYPKTVTVLQEGALNDYLAGQTEPFLGDPATPFAGLSVVGKTN